MRENEIEQYLCRQVQKYGGLAWKWVSPGRNGVPDRILIFPQNVVCFVELKAPGKEERPLQRIVQTQMRKLGCQVFSSVDSKEKVDEIVNWCLLETGRRIVPGGVCS